MASPTVFTPISVDPVQLGVAAAVIYTAGAGGAILDHVILVNDTTTQVTATIYYVPSGGAAGVTNILANAITIPSDGFPVNLLEMMQGRPFHMEAGGTLEGLASVAAQVTCHVGGVDYA